MVMSSPAGDNNGKGGNGGAAAFLYKYRKVILTTVVTTTSLVGAYYVYNTRMKSIERGGKKDDGSVPPPSAASTSANKKKNKKNKKKTKKNSVKDEDAKDGVIESEKKPGYPVRDGTTDEPDFEKINNKNVSEGEEGQQKPIFTKEDKEAFAIELKDKGNELFKLKKFDEALKYYHWALELKKDPIFYSNISACYVSLEQLDKVVENCNMALELKPDYSKALLRRASAYESLQQYDNAMFDLSVLSLNNDFNGASIEPMLERTLNKQALKILDEKLINQKEKNIRNLPSDTAMASFFGIFTPELSFNNYDESNEIDQNLLKGLQKLYGSTHEGFIEADKIFEKCVSDYQSQYDNNKENDSVKEKLAIALEYNAIFKFLKNDIENSQVLLNKSIELHPRVNSYIYLALSSADKIATDITNAAANGSDINSATSNNNKNDYLTFFDKAIELDSKNSSIYYHRGQINFILQDYENAKTDFLKAKELDPENIFAYIQLACLSYREDKFDDCVKQFEETRQKFPIAPEVPTFYSEILADKNDFVNALKQYDIAKKLEDANFEKNNGKINVGVAPLIGKATVLARQPSPENFNQAAELFEMACEKDPKSEQAKVGLAQLKLQQEDVDTAIQLFDDAADLARSYDEKLQAITFAEAAKIQKRIRADPVIRKKVEEALAQYRAQGLM